MKVFNLKSIGDPFTFLEPDFGAFLIYEFFAGDYTPTENLTNNQFLKIYPNPSEDIFFAELEGYSGNVQMDLYNQMGQVLQTVELENATDFVQQTFDLSDYSAGIYYLKINHGNVTEVRKLIRL